MKPQIVTVDADDRPVWRVGFRPKPFVWAGWQYATDGRFAGRWDDHDGHFRSCYVADEFLGALLEALAPLRPDVELLAELDEIDDDPEAPTISAGTVTREWLTPRCAGTAILSGNFCQITHSRTIAALRPTFLRLAVDLGLEDFDAAALRDARPRELTQQVATHLYRHTDVAGVRFGSRLGDDQPMWAIFERPGDPPMSPRLTHARLVRFGPRHPDFKTALEMHGLRWVSRLNPVD